MQALKEWAIVCKALEEGIQIILVRKGGILEYKDGFSVNHDKFLLYPTFEHQTKESLKPWYANRLDVVMNGQPAEGINIITCLAHVKHVKEDVDRLTLQKIGLHHVWSDQCVTARMDYNPKKPTTVMVLRVFRLINPIVLTVKPEWSGCKSWIAMDSLEPNDEHVEINGFDDRKNRLGIPALDDTKFAEAESDIMQVLDKA